MTTQAVVAVPRRVLFAVLALVLVLAGVVAVVLARGGGSGVDPVLVRISSETSCAVLQQEFDLATAASRAARGRGDEAAHRTAVSEMEAANERMKAVGCYG